MRSLAFVVGWLQYALHRLGVSFVRLASALHVRALVVVCDVPEDRSRPVKAFCDVIGSDRLRVGHGAGPAEALADLARRDFEPSAESFATLPDPEPSAAVECLPCPPGCPVCEPRTPGRFFGLPLLALALVLVGCVPSDPPTSSPAPSVSSSSPTSAEVRAATNQYRARHGLPSLAEDARLDASASVQAQAFARSGRRSHLGADGSGPGERISRAGLDWSVCGENVAESPGPLDASALVDLWASDRDHRANLLGPFSRLGTASAVDASGRVFWVSDYASERP